MDLNNKKEQFHIAYIKAIAAQCGIKHSDHNVDDDSIDITLKGKDFTGHFSDPAVDIQLKCTSNPKITKKELTFSLNIKNYDDLRSTNTLSPRYLMVLIVPKDSQDWIEYNPDNLTVKNLCYWVCIQGMKPTSNTSSVDIKIPITNILDSSTLTKIMEEASNGRSL